MVNLREELKRLADMTERTGVKYEIQCLQLQTWGKVVWPGGGSYEVTWDYEKRSVEYAFTKKKTPKDFARRAGALCFYTKELLGDKYRVLIRAGEKVVFDAPPGHWRMDDNGTDTKAV